MGADGRHRRQIPILEGKVGPHFARPLDKELNRLAWRVLPSAAGDSERRDPELLLPVQSQRDTTRHQDMEPRRSTQKLGQPYAGRQHLLEVVEDQKQVLVPQP